MKEIPNYYLWEAITVTGGLLQTLVPFGEDEKPYLAAATDDLDTIEVDWVNKGVIYATTLRNLFPENTELPSPEGLDETPCCARFFHGQSVKIPLGDGSYQHCVFVGMDMHGISTVKTRGGRYKQVWDYILYPHNETEEREG